MGSSKDSSSGKKWVVVSLSPNAEKEKNINIFARSVKRHLGKDLEVFVPAANLSAREDTTLQFYMDGYIFIEYVQGVNYMKLNETNLFSFVLSKPSTGICLVSDADILPMREGVKTMRVGSFVKNDEVKVVKGSFKNLTGRVSEVYDGGEFVQIDIGLLSKPMLIDYPANYLVKV